MKSTIKKSVIFLALILICFFLYDTYKYKFYDNKNTISVLTYNCGNVTKTQPTLELVSEVIEYAGKPDIVFLQDLAWIIKAPALCKKLDYPYYATTRNLPVPVSNLVILSKYPLSNHEKFIIYPENKIRALTAVTKINNTKTLLCCVKLSSLSRAIAKDDKSLSLMKLTKVLLKEYFSETTHTRTTRKLLKHISNKNIENVIIGADFNTPPFSKPVRMLSKKYKDSFRYSLKYFSGTRIKYFLRPRIDYIFASKNFNVIKKQVIKKTYGDHFPVYATIKIN